MAEPCGRNGCVSGLPTRMYAKGHRCAECTPAALAGKPEPDEGRYCAPKRCLCGRCPGYTPVTPYSPTERTVLDNRAEASGKRRTGSIGQYRAAQAAVARKTGDPV